MLEPPSKKHKYEIPVLRDCKSSVSIMCSVPSGACNLSSCPTLHCSQIATSKIGVFPNNKQFHNNNHYHNTNGTNTNYFIQKIQRQEVQVFNNEFKSVRTVIENYFSRIKQFKILTYPWRTKGDLDTILEKHHNL